MTRDVYKAERLPIRNWKKREAEIDGDTARLFFLQPVSVDAGQCLDERCLAVIDVARGADDHAERPIKSSDRDRIGVQPGNDGNKFLFLVEAAKIQNQSAVCNPPDYRPHQSAQGGGQ